MNKLFTQIATAFVGIAMAIGVGVAVGSHSDVRRADADTLAYTITFATGSGDGTKGSTSTSMSSYTSSNKVTGNATTATNAYYAGGSGLKLGTSSASGSLGFNLASAVTATKVTVNAKRYNSTKAATIKLGTLTAQNLTANFADYEFALTGSLSSLLITTSKYAWVASVSVYVSGSSISTTTTVTATGDKTTLETGKSPADTVQLIPVVKDSNQNVLSVSVSYAVTTGSAVTVSSAGLVTAASVGQATITVSYAGGTISGKTYSSSSGTIQITVTEPFPDSGKVTISTIDKIGSGTGYADYDGSHSTSIPNSSLSLTWTSSNVMAGGSHLQFKKSGAGYIYNTVDLGNIISVTPSDSNLTVFYGTSQHPTSGSSVGTGNGYFTVINNATSAVSGATITIEWGTAVTLDSIAAELDSTAAQKTWHVNDPLKATEVDVTPSYSDGSGTKVEDGTGVYFNPGLTETTYTFSATGNVTVPVYYRDANGRTANTTFTVINVQPAKTVQAWSITGEIGETAKTVDYDLSGLTLHAWYDAQKTDEASSEVAALYELVANPTTAGESSDPNNTINVEVYLKTDTSHTNRLALFENVAAPIVDAPKGSEDNPFTIAEAMAAITWTTNTSSDDEYYAIGFVKKVVNASTNHSYFLVDDPNDTTSTDKECLQAYNRDAPTDWDANATGDKVKVKGYLTYYNGQKELGKSGSGNGFSIISVDPETLSLVLSVTEEDVIINSTYSYSGTITADYKHKNDVVYDGVDSRFTITSNVNTAVVGDYTYTVTYDDGLFEEIEESCTVHVKYAEVSSVTLTEHNVPMGIDDGHQFTASLNEGVNPSNVISWSVANDVGSEIPTSEFEIDETGYLVISTQTPGTLIVTASCAGFSDHCTVVVTGDPYATFNKASIKGIVGANIDSSVIATPNGLAGSPTSYTWSIKTGEATDVISFTNGNASTTLTFLKAGSTVLHVVISDGSAKTAEGDIEVDVIDSLHSVVVPGKTTESSDTTTFSEMGLESGTQYESLTSPSDSNITFAFGDGGNDGKYYTTGTAIRVYSSGHMTVAHASKTISKIELAFGSGDGSNAITTEVGTYSNGTWTGSASSVTFNVGGSSGHRRIASVKVYWETSSSDTPVSNINYNSQKAILDFASQFSTMLNNVCDQATGDTPMSGDDGLIKKWGDIQSAFTNFRNSLSTSAESGKLSERDIFDALIANADKDQGGDALERALSSYDYVYSKYHAALDGEVAGSADFLHNVSERDPVSYAPRILPTLLVGKVTNTSIIVIVTVGIAAIAIGGYFLLRKKKED